MTKAPLFNALSLRQASAIYKSADYLATKWIILQTDSTEAGPI